MHKQIDRRDFLQGAAITIMAAIGGVAPELAAAAERAAQDRKGYYPPTRTDVAMDQAHRAVTELLG